MQINWDEGIFSRVNWLYDLYTPLNNGIGIIHIPLLYLTKLQIQQELYAKALIDLPACLKLTDLINPEIIDGSAVRFSTENLEIFRLKLYELIANNTEIHNKIIKQILFIKKYFPKLCIKAEKDFLNNNNANPLIINRLYKMLIRLISINLMNPFFEILYTKTNNLYAEEESYKETVHKILWQPINTNYIYFSKLFENIKKTAKKADLNETELLNFCWNYSFLEDTIGDGSKFENPNYLASQISFKNKINNTITSENVLYPQLEFDPTGLTNSFQHNINFRESFLLTFRYLQVNEEFRHYWGLRYIRLLRYIVKDKKCLESWGINEYIEFLKK